MAPFRPVVLAAYLVLQIAFLPIVAFAQAPKPATGTLTVAFAAEATMLDPTRSSAGVDQYFFGQMFEQLVRPDPSLKRVNWLAESWEVKQEDGKPYLDIYLRKGVKFHNGDPLTSEDFEYAFRRQSDSKISIWTHLQAAVEKFEIVDPVHFRIRFKEGDGSYIANDLTLWAMPKHYMEQVGDEAFERAPVGTGPWKFVSRSVKDEIRFEAFDDYWNTDYRPTVKNLVIKVIPEDLTRVAAFKTGAVDWIDAVPPAMVEEFKKMPGVVTASYPAPNNMYIAMDALTPESKFYDVRVRQALAYAINVDAIIKSILFGQGERYVEVGKGELGYDPDLKPYPYDPKKARELLREAGYPNGFDTPCYNLTTPREPYQKEVGEAYFAYASAVGIRCKVQGMEYGTWISFGRRQRQGHIDGLYSNMWGHGLPGDPGVAWAGHVHSYVPGQGWGATSVHSDPELDGLIEELKRTMDIPQREALARKIARIKHERVAGGLTTYRPVVTFAWRDTVTFRAWPMAYWRDMQEIGLKQ
jgi:peptide/nickel transport system substrate-binding protein